MRQLGEVVVNLMVNALDEMPQGGCLKVSVEPDATDRDGSPGSWARIDVTDSGPGIQEKDLDRLFEPFFTTKASGSGLGLSIVRGTVQKHGGLVRVRTAPGAGTTFSHPPARQRETPRIASMSKILIVDNDDGLIHFLGRLFVKQDYEVASCTNGTAAIERLATGEPFRRPSSSTTKCPASTGWKRSSKSNATTLPRRSSS